MVHALYSANALYNTCSWHFPDGCSLCAIQPCLFCMYCVHTSVYVDAHTRQPFSLEHIIVFYALRWHWWCWVTLVSSLSRPQPGDALWSGTSSRLKGVIITLNPFKPPPFYFVLYGRPALVFGYSKQTFSYTSLIEENIQSYSFPRQTWFSPLWKTTVVTSTGF